MATNLGLPQGFILDEQQQGVSQLPQGFVIDDVQQQPQKTPIVGGLAKQAIEDPRSLVATGRGALKGATLGFSEKLAPYLAAGTAKVMGEPTPYGELVQQSKGIEKEYARGLEEEYPKAYTAGEIGGALLSPINKPFGALAKGIGGVKGAVAAGAGEGALMGVGYGEGLEDIKENALVGGLLGGGLYGVAKGAGLAMKAIKPLVGRISPKKSELTKMVKTLKKEGVTPEEARNSLQKMQDEGVALIDVVDPRSSLIARVPERAYEKATIDTIDGYNAQLNSAGNKAKTEILDLISKKKISPQEGAELIGQNAQEVISRQKKIRTAKAKPLYDKAFEDKNVNPSGRIFKIPKIQEAIRIVKEESKQFGKGTIGDISKKPNNSIEVLHQTKDYLYRKSKDFNDLEYTRYNQLYQELSEKLKQASPSYRKATEIWAGETKGIEELYKQKGIGNIAKKYEKGDIDGIRSSIKNVFKKGITDEEITRLKGTLSPEDFNAVVRKDLDTLIDEGGDAGSNLTNSLFGKGDAERSLKNKRLDLVFTPNQKRGLKKTSEILDNIKTKEKQLDKLAFRETRQQLEYIYGGQFAIANALLKTSRALAGSPKQRESFVNYLFTQQGQDILEQISKGDKVQSEKLIMQILPAILTQTQGEE